MSTLTERPDRVTFLERKDERKMPHGWWILPGAIMGAWLWYLIGATIVSAVLGPQGV